MFDVWIGRTAQEVVQVRSLHYPTGARLVRTITITRVASGFVYRYDSGWVAETPGLYDFGYTAYTPGTFPHKPTVQGSPYEIHPGPVRGFFHLRNIRKAAGLPPFTATWVVPDGGTYVNDKGELETATPATPLAVRTRVALLEPVTCDADVQIDDVTQGGSPGPVPGTTVVPTSGMLGYVQLAPRGEPLPREVFAQLLSTQFGAVGGPGMSIGSWPR